MVLKMIIKNSQLYLYSTFFIITCFTIKQQGKMMNKKEGWGVRRKWRDVCLTSKLTDPLLCVSKASNRKCAYIFESGIKRKLKKGSMQISQCKCVITALTLQSTHLCMSTDNKSCISLLEDWLNKDENTWWKKESLTDLPEGRTGSRCL